MVHHHQLAAGGGIGHQNGVAPGGMEEGYRQQVGVLASAADVSHSTAAAEGSHGGDEEQVHQVGGTVAVGSHCTFGASGGAGGVEDGGIVIRFDVSSRKFGSIGRGTDGFGERDHRHRLEAVALHHRTGRCSPSARLEAVSYTHLRAHETVLDLV